MDRSGAFPPERQRPMPSGWPATFDVVLRAGWRDGREPCPDAADRRTVPATAVFRQSQDGRAAWGQPEAYPAADATDGAAGDLSEATHDAARGWAPDLPVFAAGDRGCATGPGVGHRHHLRADATWFLVPGGDHGLVQPLRAGLAAVEHPGRDVLPGDTGRSVEPWAARDFQQRSGQPVYGNRLHEPAGGFWHRDQHGRSWPGDGQRVHRTPLAYGQVRRDLPEGLRDGVGGRRFAGQLLSV